MARLEAAPFQNKYKVGLFFQALQSRRWRRKIAGGFIR